MVLPSCDLDARRETRDMRRAKDVRQQDKEAEVIVWIAAWPLHASFKIL